MDSTGPTGIRHRVHAKAKPGSLDFSATNWYAFVAQGKTPAAILDRWNAELVKALNAPDVKAQPDRHGRTPAPSSREELARHIAAESTAWGSSSRRVIKAD
jgi:tripartite-type tricarboxylate transporter receptor subunit TctC